MVRPWGWAPGTDATASSKKGGPWLLNSKPSAVAQPGGDSRFDFASSVSFPASSQGGTAGAEEAAKKSSTLNGDSLFGGKTPAWQQPTCQFPAWQPTPQSASGTADTPGGPSTPKPSFGGGFSGGFFGGGGSAKTGGKSDGEVGPGTPSLFGRTTSPPVAANGISSGADGTDDVALWKNADGTPGRTASPSSAAAGTAKQSGEVAKESEEAGQKSGGAGAGSMFGGTASGTGFSSSSKPLPNMGAACSTGAFVTSAACDRCCAAGCRGQCPVSAFRILHRISCGRLYAPRAATSVSRHLSPQEFIAFCMG